MERVRENVEQRILSLMSFLCYHGSARRNKGNAANTGIGVVTLRRIGIWYLCFPVLTHLSLPLA